MTTTHGQRLLRSAEVRSIVNEAGRAPSVHNTQPWKFGWDGRSFTLHADTSRGLSVADPEGRELVISCGAALFNLRLALRKHGYVGDIEVMPTKDPRLLARIDVRTGPPADTEERLMFAAMRTRHTHRTAFEDRPVEPALEVRLQQAATEEGAHLFYVSDPGQRGRILHLARAAERHLTNDPRVRAEIESWAPGVGVRKHDGIPPRAFPQTPAVENVDDLSPRDFDLERGIGELADAQSPHPGALAVLTSDRDTTESWLAAGQALERVLVTAARYGAAAALHSQIAEVHNLRSELQRELCTSTVPQLLLRLGYAPAVTLTPRRAVDDILIDLG